MIKENRKYCKICEKVLRNLSLKKDIRGRTTGTFLWLGLKIS